MILLRENRVDIASVGDSRAVLGSTREIENPPAFPRPLRGEAKAHIESVQRKRAISMNSPIYQIQLTKDQKPEDPEELVRIFKAGGRVHQLTDEQGNKIGPYRVWKPNTNGPGIAMSRSIGDTIGSDLGVISEPIITELGLNWDTDLFMVAASDGVWDVMDNNDVVKFVEKYRSHCVKGDAPSAPGYPVNCTNATIAHLLCEEARARWFYILEQEEVFIDDISCVIAELQGALKSGIERNATTHYEDSA
jgi:serine/threonine protein phosphatase PrpC